MSFAKTAMANIDLYKTKLEAYKADVQEEIEIIRAFLDEQRQNCKHEPKHCHECGRQL